MEEKSKENNTTKKIIYAILGVLLIVVAVVLVILFLLRGNTTISDSTRTDIVTESLSCEANDVEYPIFTFDKSDKKSFKINMVFGEKKLDTLSLIYRLYYSNTDDITESEVTNHIAMNESFADDGLQPNSFGAVFATLNDSMQMTLNAVKKQINGSSAKYFLLEEVANYSKDNLKKHYESKGFECKEY